MRLFTICFAVDCDLNSTTPPSLEILEETDQPEVKCDTETVFKKIDQLLPTVNKISPETADKNTSKSEETQAILHNLSAILDKECRDPNAKQQGHDLISSLAVIITKKRLSFSCDRSSLEDSGHSSIDGDLDDQPLDLRMNKSAKGEQVSKPRFSRSLTDGNGSSKAETGKMSESLKNQEESGKMKFKLKKTTEKAAVSKTGPLKAVIPITNMTKASCNIFK